MPISEMELRAENQKQANTGEGLGMCTSDITQTAQLQLTNTPEEQLY